MINATEQGRLKDRVRSYLHDLPQCAKVRRQDYGVDDWYDNRYWLQLGREVKPSRRGLTWMDIFDPNEVRNVGEAHMAARGAYRHPSMDPHPWAINEKHVVWSDALPQLLEEGIARQWSATRDIPWDRFTPLPPDLAKASAAFATMLSMGEYLANDAFGPWLPAINSEFMEVKLFLGVQIMDEVRHTEVFRKLALMHGTGLGPCYSFNSELGVLADLLGLPVQQFDAAHGPVSFPSYTAMTQSIHVTFEGIILDCFRFGEFLGKTEIDKEVYRRVMQDEARHVTYGATHLKYYLDHCPNRDQAIAELQMIANGAEVSFLAGIMTRPLYMQCVAILAGDGIENMDAGYEAYRVVWTRAVDEYLRRCERGGFPRRNHTLMPLEPPF